MYSTKPPHINIGYVNLICSSRQHTSTTINHLWGYRSFIYYCSYFHRSPSIISSHIRTSRYSSSILFEKQTNSETSYTPANSMFTRGVRFLAVIRVLWQKALCPLQTLDFSVFTNLFLRCSHNSQYYFKKVNSKINSQFFYYV